MLYRTYIPGPPLSDFVEMFWFHQGQDSPHAKERVLPNGSMALIINLGEDRFRVYDSRNHDLIESLPGSIVAGARSEYAVIDSPNRASLIGVHFKPGGAFPFFKLPAGELHNESVSLEMLWGAWARELRERLLEQDTPESMFGILERALMSQAIRAARPRWRHPAVAFALEEFHSDKPTIADVTDRIGLSPRRFIQLFNEEVGLTPKLFCRIRRFQEVLTLIAHPHEVDWTHMALTCGYFDQAHFIHDFRAFSGISPTTYLANRSQYQNHVPLHE